MFLDIKIDDVNTDNGIVTNYLGGGGGGAQQAIAANPL